MKYKLISILIIIIISSIPISAQSTIFGEGQGITGIGIQTGNADVQATVSCVQGCVQSCIRACTTQQCGYNCGKNCADKCVSGVGITQGTPDRRQRVDIAGYCRAARSCTQCAQRNAYRCLWNGNTCIQCKSPSCVFSCGRTRIVKTITNKKLDTQTRERINEKGLKDNKKIDNLDLQNKYPHCFDGRKNYREKGIDCGGYCRDCKEDEIIEAKPHPIAQKIIDFFNWLFG